MEIGNTIERKTLRIGILLGLFYQIYQTITSIVENGLINNTTLVNVFVTIIFLILFGFTYTKIPTAIPAAGIHTLLLPVFYFFWVNYGGVSGTVPDFLCVYLAFIITTSSGWLMYVFLLIYTVFIYGLAINPFLTGYELVFEPSVWNRHLTYDYFIVAIIIILQYDYLKRTFNTYRVKSDNRVNQITQVAASQQERNLELLAKQEEINQLNETLQSRINERVEVLEKQRELLERYAFMNAHLLRAPVCRILGLINLMKVEQKNLSPELMKLQEYALEIDQIARKINEIVSADDH